MIKICLIKHPKDPETASRTCGADGREGSVLVGGAAAAAVAAVRHLQDVADDGLFVHR